MIMTESEVLAFGMWEDCYEGGEDGLVQYEYLIRQRGNCNERGVFFYHVLEAGGDFRFSLESIGSEF